MTATPSTMEQAHIADQHLEMRIAADPSKVWQALTSDIGKWWPSEFFCGGGSDASERRFLLEAWPGGRMWEDWGSGDGLLWATVVNVVAGKTLEMSGFQGPAWGGPNAWYSSYALEADGDGTKLRFSESGFGRMAESMLADKETGWRFLFATMAAHLEGKEPPKWG
ncbi:MAG: SRPBCC domain-containing protein [Acidobacteriota bacterium]